jgi:NTE family protein
VSLLPPLSSPSPLPLALALQGGGAHGAYTWGVLDALLETGAIQPTALSGTSAGAMNALLLAQGWTAARDAGRPPAEGAREALAEFWLGVARLAPVDFGGTHGDAAEPTLSPALRLVMQWGQLMALSPYQLGPGQLGPLLQNPLRELLLAQVDAERIAADTELALYLAATQANTGRLRLFGNAAARAASPQPQALGGLDIDAALASACLPTLQPAVMIEGEPYWDGGYSANPALLPLVQGQQGRLRTDLDLLLVLLTPRLLGPTPESAAEIRARTVELAFQTAFLRELELLAALEGLAGRSGAASSSSLSRWTGRLGHWLTTRLGRAPGASPDGSRAGTGPRWHVIEAELGHLRSETKLIARRDFLLHLRDAGRAAGQAWWAQAQSRLGRCGSISLAELLAPPA